MSSEWGHTEPYVWLLIPGQSIVIYGVRGPTDLLECVYAIS